MDKLAKLQELIKLTTESLSRQEFTDAFKVLTDFIRKTDTNLTSKIDNKLSDAENKLEDLQSDFQKAVDKVNEEVLKIKEDNQSTISNVKKWALQRVSELFLKSNFNSELSKRLQSFDIEFNQKINDVNLKISEINSYTLPEFIPPNTTELVLETSKLVQKEIEALVPKLDWSQELPKYGFEIRDALELLEDGEKLEIDAIQDLRKELDELKKQIRAKVTTFSGGGSSGGGRVVKIYSLSSQLNGVLKTFSLPAFWRIINVHSTSFPNSAFEPTTDYTWDASASTITFTSEISASSTLSFGQTLLIEYAE